MRTPGAAAAALLIAATLRDAGAAAVDAVDIAPGETVLAEVSSPGRYDEFRAVLPRGAQASWSLGPTAPAGISLSIGGMLDDEFRDVPLALVPPATARSATLEATGRYAFFVTGADGTTGGYRLKLTVRAQRKATVSATGDAAPAPLVFGAFSGSEIDVKLRWTGAAPVTVDSIDGPDGALADPGAPVVKGATSFQRGFLATATGDHSVTFDVPAGTGRWDASLAIRAPKPAGGTRDLRDPSGGPAPGLALDPPTAFGQFPFLRVLGERGGPNDLSLCAEGAAPAFAIGDPRVSSCGIVAVPGAEPPQRYVAYCNSGAYRAEIDTVVRGDGGRVLSYFARLVAGPEGSGSSQLTFSAWDGNGRPTAWREDRRFDETGRVHRLDVSQVVRRGDGAVRSYRVVHMPPGGEPRTYEYAPFR